jgi:hypothetical protein
MSAFRQLHRHLPTAGTLSQNVRDGAANIVGKRVSEEGCRRPIVNEKRREAELSYAIFAHDMAITGCFAYVSRRSIIGAMASGFCISFFNLPAVPAVKPMG